MGLQPANQAGAIRQLFARHQDIVATTPPDCRARPISTINSRCAPQRASLVGELSLQATYTFRPNLVGQASYNFMWITGLALGADQLTWSLDPAGNNTINTNGTVFYQGPRSAWNGCGDLAVQLHVAFDHPFDAELALGAISGGG